MEELEASDGSSLDRETRFAAGVGHSALDVMGSAGYLVGVDSDTSEGEPFAANQGSNWLTERALTLASRRTSSEEQQD